MPTNIVTFRDLIASNKRASFWLVLGFIFFIMILAMVLGVAFISLSSGYHSWDQFRTGIFVGMIAGVIACFISSLAYFSGDSLVLGVAGARPLEPGQDPELQNVVEEIAIAAGVPTPKIYLIYDPAMNAFATGRD